MRLFNLIAGLIPETMKRALLCLLASILWLETAARPVKGRVLCDKSPVGDVLVTDGYSFARTDAAGNYTLDLDERAHFVSVVTPSGYIAPSDEGFPRFYRAVEERTSRYDFELLRWEAPAAGYELLAIADPQPKTEAHFERLSTEIIPVLKSRCALAAAEATPQAALILGDIVWDSPQLMAGVKRLFGELGIAVYPVIGNHDHDLTVNDDDASAANYRRHFGPTYYAFDLGRTHYIVLDDIVYHGKKRYDEQLDSLQLDWASRYARLLPQGSRVCIAMHAPVYKAWIAHTMESIEPLLAAFAGFELHFITGHTHINSNYELRDGVTEHNVAQLCGNLWHDPMNADGTPKGYQLFREEGDSFAWQYQRLDEPAQRQLKVWLPGQTAANPDRLVVKAWNWDSYWTVVWYEDGCYKGSMQRTRMADPDYTARLDSLRGAGVKLARPQAARPAVFYFTARPSAGTREVTVVATDRFGRRYTEQVRLR